MFLSHVQHKVSEDYVNNLIDLMLCCISIYSFIHHFSTVGIQVVYFKNTLCKLNLFKVLNIIDQIYMMLVKLSFYECFLNIPSTESESCIKWYRELMSMFTDQFCMFYCVNEGVVNISVVSSMLMSVNKTLSIVEKYTLLNFCAKFIIHKTVIHSNPSCIYVKFIHP